MVVFSKLGVAHKILAAYKQAVQLDPNNADARSSLATYYIVAPGMAGGSTDKANQEIALLDKLDPVQADIARANMAFENKDHQKGETYLRTAVKLDKTGNSDLQLGLVLASQNHFPEAIAAFEDGIQKDPTVSTNYYQVGHVAVLGKIHIQEGIEDCRNIWPCPTAGIPAHRPISGRITGWVCSMASQATRSMRRRSMKQL